MLVNRDPDGRPEVTPAMARRARDMGYHIVNVMCEEPGAKVGDETGISFLALVPFLPRAGDRIALENGRSCQVVRAYFKVTKTVGADGAADSILLVPNVLATLLGGE